VLTPGFNPIFYSLANRADAMILVYILAISVGYTASAQLAKKAYIKLFYS
jgi:fumarate hydratase class II